MPRDRNRNPYAPPSASSDDAPRGGDTPTTGASFDTEQRPVVLCLVLMVVTLGVYPAIWFLRRRPFLDSFETSVKLGPTLPMMALGINAVSVFVGFIVDLLDAPIGEVDPFLSAAAVIVTVIASFRVAAILRSQFTRTGRFLNVSSVATFFFGILYLQYKINQAARTPARVIVQ